VGVDPVQILIIANPANASGNTPPETLNLTIGLAGGARANQARCRERRAVRSSDNAVRDQQFDAARPSGGGGRGGRRSGVLLQHPGVRHDTRDARDVLIERRRADLVRLERHPARHCRDSPEAELLRTRRGQ
jgi:hypothetical protein